MARKEASLQNSTKLAKIKLVKWSSHVAKVVKSGGWVYGVDKMERLGRGAYLSACMLQI